VTDTLSGLRYVREYVDAATHDDLLATVSALPWKDIPGHRRMQFYGYTYDYLSRSIKRTGKLPPWARRIARRIHEDGLSPRIPAQLAVNAYEPGQGIFTHVDADIFDDVVVISLGSPCVMDFEDSASEGTTRLLIEPRSALVLAGDARYRWKHGIVAREADEWEGRTIPRGPRVSLTFRNIQQLPGDAP
jgi:alkylated DNA repair dioxygenase AlkB